MTDCDVPIQEDGYRECGRYKTDACDEMGDCAYYQQYRRLEELKKDVGLLDYIRKRFE